MNDIVKLLPEMKVGKELLSALTQLPNYDEDIRNRDETARLIALSDLYKIYIPSEMSVEIYSKLYLSLLKSVQNKNSKTAMLQRNENYKAIQKQEYCGIMGGSDSFTIIGNSGIGKSSAINRSINMLMENGVINTLNPYTTIIPCLVVQCPYDSSVKGLLLEILRKVDEIIDSEYYINALKVKATTDMLIGSVSQVAINHIGLLIVDEIQNVVNSKNGKNLVGMLTQLINNSGISICMVGTPESSLFFEQAMQLARRSLGLHYKALEYNQFFYDFCKTIFQFQYTKYKSDISDSIIQWLYEHSGGIVSLVVSLIHDAQEIAILNGSEILNIESLNKAYKNRLSMLHAYIKPTTARKNLPVQKIQNTIIEEKSISSDDFSIAKSVADSNKNTADIISLLNAHISIEEVRL